MRLPLHEYVLALTVAVALAVLLMRLLFLGLTKKYKYFSLYLLIDLAQTCSPFFISSVRAYLYFFVVTEALMVFCFVLVLLELYSLLLLRLLALKKIAQRYSIFAIGVSIAAAAMLRTVLPSPRTALRELWYFEAPIIASLVLLILLIGAFLVYYPVPLHRNALMYAVGYVIYFLSRSLVLFLNNTASTAITRSCSSAAMAIDIVCLVFWAVALNRQGEAREIVAGMAWNTPLAQERVLNRLRELNDSLLRTRGELTGAP